MTSPVPSTSAAPATADDHRLLAALAVALVERPRATLQELARAVGVSKATLYRFSRTREQLIDRLMTHCAAVMGRSLEETALQSGPPLEALRRLIQGQLAHRELSAFILYYWKPESYTDPRLAVSWNAYQDTLDAFFLNGQRAGVFRIDIAAAGLSETLISLLSGMVDAEHRGRIARAAMASTIEQVFLKGAAA